MIIFNPMKTIYLLIIILLEVLVFNDISECQNTNKECQTYDSNILLPAKTNPVYWLMPFSNLPEANIAFFPQPTNGDKVNKSNHEILFDSQSPLVNGCGYDNNDDRIYFPDFGINYDHSPDYLLDAGSHSEISVFADPRNKENVQTSDMAGELLPTSNDHFYSTDRGLHWTWEYLNSEYNSFSDPSIVIDQAHRVTVSFLSNRGSCVDKRIADVRCASYYANSWHGPYIISDLHPGDNYNCFLLDKPHLWIDNYSGIEGKFENMYCAWNPLPVELGGNPYPNLYEIEIKRSPSEGVTWEENPHVISHNTYSQGYTWNRGANIHTGPNGEVYVVWVASYLMTGGSNRELQRSEMDPEGASTPPPEQVLVFIRSLDGGQSYQIDNQTYGKVIQNINGLSGSNYGGGARLSSFPSMCVDNSEGPHRGRIYVVWANKGVPGEPSPPSYANTDIYLIYSDDQGVNWSSPPVRVTQSLIIPNTTSTAFFPWISCDIETGVLTVISYDDRGDANYTSTYVAMSKDYGVTWDDCRISDYSFVPNGSDNGLFFGDYIGMVATHGLAYPIWTDTRNDGVNDCIPEPYIDPFYIWGCQDNPPDVFEEVHLNNIREWESSNNIIARNVIDGTLQPNQNGDVSGFAVFNAGSEIRLLPDPNPNNSPLGFWAQNGSYVHAYIEGCTAFPPNNSNMSIHTNVIKSEESDHNNSDNSSPSIFPNPCDGTFQIEMNAHNTQNCNVIITNSYGVKIYSYTFGGKPILDIDISNNPKGLYFVTLVLNNKIYTYKLIYV